MKALVRFFFKAADGPRWLILGAAILVLLSVCSKLFVDPTVDAVPEIFGPFLIVLFFAISIFGLPIGGSDDESPWPLHLPAPRGRLFGGMCLGILLVTLPAAAMCLAGLRVAGWAEPISTLCLLLLTLAAMVMAHLAFLPGVWRRPIIWSIVRTVGLVSAGLPMLLGCLYGTHLEKLIVLAADMAIMLISYFGGRYWFERFELASGGRLHKGRAAGKHSEDAKELSNETRPSRISPVIRLLFKTIWLRWGFVLAVWSILAFGDMLGFMSFAQRSDVPPSRLFLFFLLPWMSPQIIWWLRHQLTRVWWLPRSLVFESYVLPLELLLLMTVMTGVMVADFNRDILTLRNPSDAVDYYQGQHEYGYSYSVMVEAHSSNDSALKPGEADTLSLPVVLQGEALWKQDAPVIATQFAHQLANRYGLHVSSSALLITVSQGAQVMSTRAFAGRIRSAQIWQAVQWALLVLDLAICGMATALFGKWILNWRRLAITFRMGSAVLLIGVLVWSWPTFRIATSHVTSVHGIPLVRENWHAAISSWAYTYRYALTAGLLVLAVLMHWHNHRGFKRAEWYSYGKKGGWFARGNQSA